MQDSTHYVSLANKYRPQTFEDMVGQESISKTLQNALKLGRIGHAYLFYGPRGCGKTTTARILAKALNCTGHGGNGPTDKPCGKCPQCLEIAQSADLDVLELDAASNTQVEKVREAIIDTVALAANRDRFKVFILDEVHMLSASSFNALLKTIEEPPAHVVFILATTEKHKVPATIVSRCQTFRFRPLTPDEISTHLVELAEAEGIDLSVGAAKIIAKNAGGAMRDGLTLLDRAIAYCGDHIDEKSVGEMLGLTSAELLTQAVAALCHKDTAQMHQVFQTLQAEGFDANTFLKDLKNILGDLFYFSLGQGSEPYAGAKELLGEVSPGFLARLTRKLNKLIDEVKFSDNALVSAEVGLFTLMDSVLDLDGLIRRLEALERGESVPPSTPAVPPAQKASAKTTASKSTRHQAVSAPLQAETSTIAHVKSAPMPALDKAISNRQVWDKMLTQFANSPFVYDVLINSSVEFTTQNEWTLIFAPGKEFYQIPAQNKLADLSAAASELSGRKITISLAVDPALQTAKTKGKAQTETKAVILDEEPFAQGPFAPQTSADAPEEVKDILEIFPGELMA
ncbi:MAG: DNA polymerase III subunit gamma/tau [Elusimicrobiaceae bacterium]|nr:DNA polymerase III subunit gamma/tau [Elusimicrobiaceae bacterium]